MIAVDVNANAVSFRRWTIQQGTGAMKQKWRVLDHFGNPITKYELSKQSALAIVRGCEDFHIAHTAIDNEHYSLGLVIAK